MRICMALFTRIHLHFPTVPENETKRYFFAFEIRFQNVFKAFTKQAHHFQVLNIRTVTCDVKCDQKLLARNQLKIIKQFDI